jgi:hypothetical protein
MISMIRRKAPFVGLFLVVAVAACNRSEESATGQIPASGQLPEGHPAIGNSPYTHTQEAASGPAAVVLETQDVSQYTYARVQSAGQETWVAGPLSDLAVGDTIDLGGAMGMTDFTSKELGRTFESILFLDAFRAPTENAVQHTGEVLETIPASSYTYIRVRSDGQEIWLAGPAVELSEGQVIAWGDAMTMQDFESPSLKRTFDEILFVNGVRVVQE